MRQLRALIAILLLLGVAGVAEAARDTLVIGMPTDVPIFDTHKATGLHNGSVLNQVSEPLVGLGTKGEVIPYLLESWEQSKDVRTWGGWQQFGDPNLVLSGGPARLAG